MVKFMGSYVALDGGFGTWVMYVFMGDNVFLFKKCMDVECMWW